MYNVSNADLGFTVGGTDRLHIKASGNVGIGTTVPGWQLDVRRNDTGNTPSIGIRQVGTGDASMDFQTTTSPYGFTIGVDGSDADKFKITTGPGNVGSGSGITIDNAGQVGIGTTSPSADTGVARFLQIGSSADAHSGLVIEDNSGQWEIQNNGGMTWFYDGTSKMALTTGGDATHYGALNVNTTAGDGSESRFNVNPGGAGDNCTVSIKQDDASTVGVYLQGDGASWFTGGIVPGNSGTAAANNLDDYEEGTFTPTYTVGGGGSVNSVTSTNVGTYTKVGRMCTISVTSIYVSTSGTVPTYYTIALPFQAANTGGEQGFGSGQETAQSGKQLLIHVGNSATTAYIWTYTGGAVPANSYFSFGITYQTA